MKIQSCGLTCSFPDNLNYADFNFKRIQIQGALRPISIELLYRYANNMRESGPGPTLTKFWICSPSTIHITIQEVCICIGNFEERLRAAELAFLNGGSAGNRMHSFFFFTLFTTMKNDVELDSNTHLKFKRSASRKMVKCQDFNPISLQDINIS